MANNLNPLTDVNFQIARARADAAKELDLTGCGITDLPDSLWQLNHLEKLVLRKNQISEIPEQLGQLKSLRVLELDCNQLISLPTSIGELENLEELEIEENALEYLPSSIGQLSRLKYFNAADNFLRDVPPSMANLHSLQIVELSSNRFTHFPQVFCQLKNIEELSLGHCSIRSLPQQWSKLSKLKILVLVHNQISQLPEGLAELRCLEDLDLTSNRVSELPESFFSLRSLQNLRIAKNHLNTLPPTIAQLENLTLLDVSQNALTSLPEAIENIQQLKLLALGSNQFEQVPAQIFKLRQLEELALWRNHLHDVPEELSQLKNLKILNLGANKLQCLPESIGKLSELLEVFLRGNELTQLPKSLHQLEAIRFFDVDDNPLHPEVQAAYLQGWNSLREYLKSQDNNDIVVNETKLVLVGEGGVGKSSLLAALKGEAWVEKRTSTHGVEVDIRSFSLLDEHSGREITFNGWDFGGQPIYRHTHQIFFTAPAIYLAVWEPRRGPDQCCVDEWIRMVKQRAYEDTRLEDRPRVLVVATHGGPKERSAHIDEDKLREEFGHLIEGFHHVDSKSGFGMEELKKNIVATAAAIPAIGREVPQSWKTVLDAIRERSQKDAYISRQYFDAFCKKLSIKPELIAIYTNMLHSLGHLIYYPKDELLSNTFILRPEWLSKAISYVLDDEATKENNGLVSHKRLSEIWSDTQRGSEARYPQELHPIFIKLMQRFDLSYQVVMPDAGAEATSLISQLVPGGRPRHWQQAWPDKLRPGEGERKQICRIVEADTGRSATVQGLMYRLIVRLHRYSTGRSNYYQSLHWKSGMILDDSYNGRAFIEDVAGDINVTVRAAYPERFLHHICAEISWLVDHFWKGLSCQQSVPCHAPCKGIHNLEDLVETRAEGIAKIRCSVCKTFYEIDSLMATVVAKPKWEAALQALKNGQEEIKSGLANANNSLGALIAQSNEQFDLLMTTLTDVGKDGPRLFSFEAVEPGFWDKPQWIAEKFTLTLWCEHSQLPLPILTEDDSCGVYTIELNREWVKRAAPYLKIAATTLSLVLPVATSAAKLSIDSVQYKNIEGQLNFAKSCAQSFLKGGHQVADWLSHDGPHAIDEQRAVFSQGAYLRELHSLLELVDPTQSYGGLVRVQNARREYLWVHEIFEREYY